MKTSKISVIVPIHNVESYLPRCLDSLIAQTLKEIEIICVDDGSTDNSFEILKEYAKKDRRIVAVQQENHGVEWARAEAMQCVSSEYIMFCDSDDWYNPEMCERMFKTISEQDVDIVMCDVNIVGEEDKGMEKYFSFMPKQGKYGQPFNYFNKVAMILWKSIFKKELIDKYGIVFPKDSHVKRGYDVYFLFQYLMGSRTIYFLHEKLYNYWQRSDSLVHQFNKGKSNIALSPIYGFGYVLDFMRRNCFYDTYKSKLLPWINEKYAFWLRTRINFEENGEEALKCIYGLFKPFEDDIGLQYDLLYKVLHQEHAKLLKDFSQSAKVSYFCSGVSYFYIMGIFPLLKIKKKNSKVRVYLFNFLPILKIKQKSNKIKVYLFDLFLILKIKDKK